MRSGVFKTCADLRKILVLSMVPRTMNSTGKSTLQGKYTDSVNVRLARWNAFEHSYEFL